MSIVTGKRRGPLGRARFLAPVLGLVALVGCETFEENPSPNPAVVSSQELDSQPYPNLAQVPDKPPPVTPEQIRASTAAGLEADRANAQYTAPLTAAGTGVQSAAPPPPTPAATQAAESTTSAATTAASSTAAAATAAPSAAAAAATAAPSAAAASAAQAVPDTPTADSVSPAVAASGRPTSLDQTTTAVAAAGVPSNAPGRSTIPSAAGTQAASPYTGGAAVSGSSGAASTAATTAATTAAATTSGAATATAAGVTPGPTGTPSASKTPGAQALASSRRQRRSGTQAAAVAPTPTTVASTGVVGAPVQAALPTQQPGLPLGPGPGASAAAAAAAAPLVPPQGTVGSGAVQLVAVIYFANGSAALDGRDVAVLREVAAIQRQYGGVIRVIGHASSRTAVLPQERHQMVNLQVSFDRAESVGQALLRAGLPSTALVMEGISDRQPVYHEFMVTGEAGNRRAEIFLEY
ncbi:MAG: OmpA family protein [Kiloniellales bacterium]